MRLGLLIEFLMLLLAAPSLVWSAQPLSKPADLFDEQRLHTIHIELTPRAWQLMSPRPGERYAAPRKETTRPIEGEPRRAGPAGLSYAYVRCRMEFDGEVMDDVGIRFKGNVSYGVSSGGPRRPFKVDFKRFAEGRHFRGLGELNLNNAAFDPSELREALGFAIFREAGVPAPRTACAQVYLSIPGLYARQYLGLYTLIEEVDKHFLQEHFPSTSGMLCKPEGVRGLPFIGDTFASYERYFNPKSDFPPDDGQRIVALARLINKESDQDFQEEIGNYLAVDEFLRFIAVNTLISNLDSFLSTGHNYYLYINPADHLAYFIPWDLNLAFGGYSWAGDGMEQARLSFLRPFVDRNRLIERLLAIPEHREKYLAIVRELNQRVFTEKWMKHTLENWRPVLEKAHAAAVAGDPTTRPSLGMRFVAPDLDAFLKRRCESIREQLAGKDAGFSAGLNDARYVPSHFVPYVPLAIALHHAADADGDGQVTRQEILGGFERITAAAGLAKGSALDRASALKAIESLMTPQLRKQASPQRLVAFLFRVADREGKGTITGEQVARAFSRLLGNVDRDYDGDMSSREAVETLMHTGLP